MLITFKRSGGFTGIPIQTDLDTASLPPQEAEAIEQILADINFYELASAVDQETGADRFSFELTVIDEEEAYTVYFNDQEAPAEINTLVRHLTILARRSPSSEDAGSSAEEDS